ncbi:LacI family DNA-binding transcriptional regulator [Desulfosediminicola sp.]|uniref:LacI family DNA-binding transcriptional regulator n=1 Tax=Desulfosediminicola sp. TaxID=2886825 RepID=UPI003AF23C3B
MDVTIVDISRLAGVSLATVSRVINTPEKVSPGTRQKVLKIMEEHNYIYNSLAGGLANKNTRTLGIIIPTITNPVFALATNGFQKAAVSKGYSVLLGSTEYSAAQEYHLIQLFIGKQVDGIVFTGRPMHSQSIEYLRQRNIPLIITWEKITDEEISYVTFDNALAARKAVDHLIALGHRRIAFISGKFEASGRSERRWKGYKESLQQAHIAYDDDLVVLTEFTVMAGKTAATQLLQLDMPPTAIFCTTDLLAYGAMASVQDEGKKVGPEVSIIGFDDLEMSGVMNPPLSSIRIPALQMGEIAAKTLIDNISDKTKSAVKHILDSKLIVRKSVAPPCG